MGEDLWSRLRSRRSGRICASSYAAERSIRPWCWSKRTSQVRSDESLRAIWSTNGTGFVDAETLLNQGEVVGSRAIEKGVDLVLNRRFKGWRGMRWCRANANAIVTLRTQILNHQAEAT
jgi:hypothetical protein